MDNTLRKALWGFLRPLVQLITNILSPSVGEEWEREFKKFLRKEACWVGAVPQYDFELYQYDSQKGHRIRTRDLFDEMSISGRLGRCLWVEHEVVQGWVAHPDTYPERFKGKNILLWRSRNEDGVACLCWASLTSEVVVERRSFSHSTCDGHDYTLLFATT